MIAVLTGLLLIIAAYFFDRFSSRQHRVFSAFAGAVLFAIIAFFLTAKLGTALKTVVILLAAVAGGALMSWLVVTGIFIGGVLLTVVLAYAFVFVIPLPIKTLYWGYIALFLGICGVWKKHLAAQILECATAGLLTAAGFGLIVARSFPGFFAVLDAPSAHLAANAALLIGSVAVAVIYAIYRKKTNRLEEVR